MPNEFVPPPIPTKSSSSRSTPLHTNNTFPCSPKRVNEHQVKHSVYSHFEDLKSICNFQSHSVSQASHNHYTVQHNKVQFSNSLPIQHMNYQQPLSAALHSNTSELDLSSDHHKSEKNNIVKQYNERVRQHENDYLQVISDTKTVNLY